MWNNRLLLLAVAGMIGGCANRIVGIQVDDQTAGYTKSVTVTVKEGRHNRTLQESMAAQLPANKTWSPTTVGRLTDIGTETRFVLKGTEHIRKGRQLKADYTMTYRRLGILPAENLKKTFEIIPLQTAHIWRKGVPACVHVGDVFHISYGILPAPKNTTVPLAPKFLNGQCLVKKSAGANSAGIVARCEGLNGIQIAASSTKVIAPSSVAMLTIAPALERPVRLTTTVGDYAKPEAGGTEGGGATQQEKSVRTVTMSWISPVRSEATVVQIFEVGSKTPAQEALFENNDGQFSTSLAVGKTYVYRLKSRYSFCHSSEWSPLSTSEVFAVPN
ncbi:hypothetical protein ACDA55_02450 [Rhizobium ruizarguesonis]